VDLVSHSHRDLHEVRRVRDALEAEGHQPLLFFLKCLGDDAELEDLIRREIQARQFFVLCDSPNARGSRYVQEEVGFIKSLPDKVHVELALDGDWQTQLEAIHELSRRATVYLSYARYSEESIRLARELARALRARDYRVFLDIDTLKSGEDWAAHGSRALDDAVEKGFVVVLLSPEAISSESVTRDVRSALQRLEDRGRPPQSGVIPIIASPVTLDMLQSSPWEPIQDILWLDFTVGALDDNVAELVRRLANE
jgi:TIR domain